MVKEIGFFYREGTVDYVINDRGDLYYDLKTCQTFKHLENAAEYLRRNYGERRSVLRVEGILDSEGKLDKKRISELEKMLKGTKIKIVKS